MAAEWPFTERTNGGWGVDSGVTDVHRTLIYSRQKQHRRWLAIGGFLLVVGIALAYLQFGDFDAIDRIMTVAAIVLGGGMTLYALFRMLVPGKPVLVLSPAGLRLNIEWVKDILIPWHEVEGVDTIDITGSVGGNTVFLPGVTVVLTSRSFYDRHIYIDSLLLRGPGWDTNFIPRGDMVQVALHHEALPATAQELRASVEARWLAFRDAARPSHLPQMPLGQRA